MEPWEIEMTRLKSLMMIDVLETSAGVGVALASSRQAIMLRRGAGEAKASGRRASEVIRVILLLDGRLPRSLPGERNCQ